MATVKVRIAVAVDPDGKWNAWGMHGYSDGDAMANAVEHVAEGEARYFLTAELEIPELVTREVLASVEDASAKSGREG